MWRMKDKILNELSKIVGRQGIGELAEYLKTSDFFSAPASTKFHGSYPGGLAQHSWNVFKLLGEKNERYGLGLTADTVRICGLLHDICKIGLYFQEEKWRKDPAGKWESYKAYVVKDSLPLGHGEKSVIMLQRFIELTDVEIFMIRWHMGNFIPWENRRDFNNAIALHRHVVAMSTADFEASTYLDRGPE